MRIRSSASFRLDDLQGRFFQYCRFVWPTGSHGPRFRVPGGDSAEYGRECKAASVYAALIASISGPMPMMPDYQVEFTAAGNMTMNATPGAQEDHYVKWNQVPESPYKAASAIVFGQL